MYITIVSDVYTVCYHRFFLKRGRRRLPSPRTLRKELAKQLKNMKKKVMPSGKEPCIGLCLFATTVLSTQETDEEKVLEQMIKDTEAVSLEEEQEGVAPVDDVEEDEKGGGQGAEQGSTAALLDELLVRSVCNRKLSSYCREVSTRIL